MDKDTGETVDYVEYAIDYDELVMSASISRQLRQHLEATYNNPQMRLSTGSGRLISFPNVMKSE